MATDKIEYGASVAITITLASLATSSSRVAGRESTAINNTVNKYYDYLVSGRITLGTTPTVAKSVEVWVYANADDTPTYPDVFDGTDSAETVTSEAVKQSALRLGALVAPTEATTDRVYWIAPFSVAALFGRMPKYWGLFVTHDTGVNLHATGGNHVLSYTPIYGTIA